MNPEPNKPLKILIICRGASGSGKSTLAKTLAKAYNAAGPFEADDYMVNDKCEYKFDPSRLRECHHRCRQAVEMAMQREEEYIIQSNTNTTHKETLPYFALALKYGYEVQEIILKANFGNVHGVPPEKIEQMKARFQY